jgi:hypothetical protein
VLSITANCDARGLIVEPTRGRYISGHSFTQSACERLSGEAVPQRSLRYEQQKTALSGIEDHAWVIWGRRPVRAALDRALNRDWLNLVGSIGSIVRLCEARRGPEYEHDLEPL